MTTCTVNHRVCERSVSAAVSTCVSKEQCRKLVWIWEECVGCPYNSYICMINNAVFFLLLWSSASVPYHITPLICYTVFQVIWCPGRCTICSRCTLRTPAMAPRSTRRPTPQCTGSQRPSTPCVTSCTARRWNGRTPMLNPPKSPYRLRGESAAESSVLWPQKCPHGIVVLSQIYTARGI